MICDICKRSDQTIYKLKEKELCLYCWREYAPIITGARIYVDLIYDSLEPTDNPIEI